DASTLPKMYAALASERPPPSLQAVRHDVPEALEEALARCFARDRENRVQNVAELAGSLLDAVDAPFAAAGKPKIQAMLDPRRDALTSSGPRALGTGAYSLLASSIMTSSSAAMRAPKPPQAPAHAEIPVHVEAPPARGRWAAIGGGLVGAVIAGLVVVFAMSRGGQAPAPSASAPVTTGAVAATPPGTASAPAAESPKSAAAPSLTPASAPPTQERAAIERRAPNPH